MLPSFDLSINQQILLAVVWSSTLAPLILTHQLFFDVSNCLLLTVVSNLYPRPSSWHQWLELILTQQYSKNLSIRNETELNIYRDIIINLAEPLQLLLKELSSKEKKDFSFYQLVFSFWIDLLINKTRVTMKRMVSTFIPTLNNYNFIFLYIIHTFQFKYNKSFILNGSVLTKEKNNLTNVSAYSTPFLRIWSASPKISKHQF